MKQPISTSANEDHYKLLFKHAPGAYVSLDHNCEIVDVNDKWLDLFELKDTTDTIGLKFINYIEKDKQEEFKLICKKHEIQNSFSNFECRIQTPGGRSKFISINGQSVLDQQGSFIQLHCLISDITESKQADSLNSVLYNITNTINEIDVLGEVLVKVKDYLHEIIDTSNFYVALLNDATQTLYTALQTGDNNFAEIEIERKMASYILSEKNAILLTKTEAVDAFPDFDFSGVDDKIWMGVPLRTRNGFIGSLILKNKEFDNYFSLSDLKILEIVSSQIAHTIDRKRNEELLEQSTKRFQLLYENMPGSACLINDQYKIQNINKTFSQISGWQKERIVGVDCFNIFSELDSDIFINLLQQNDYIENLETHIFLSNGEELPIILSVRKMLFEGNNSWILNFTDISDRVDAEQKLTLAKEKAEEADRLKTSFLSNMSHEIRTPMNAILGFTSFLKDTDYNQEEKEEFVDIIQENGNALLNLIDDIIDIAKIEAGQINLNSVDCNIAEIIRDVHFHFAEPAENPNVKLSYKYDTRLDNLLIKSDPFRLGQVLRNLIGNAVKFTAEGLIQISCQIINNRFLEFKVSDSGIGMTEEQTQFIFERFRQVDETHTKNYGGTGLGLSISRSLVNLLGGDIWVRSQAGIGSDFYFTIPYIPSHQLQSDTGANQPSAQFFDWSTKNLLVVEDVDSNYMLISAILGKTNVKLHRAEDGLKAVEMANNFNYDLILMDIQLPKLNGYEATKRIKKLNPDVPVISQTAYAMEGERQKSLNAGCDDYISKPINSRLLLKKINAIFTK